MCLLGRQPLSWSREWNLGKKNWWFCVVGRTIKQPLTRRFGCSTYLVSKVLIINPPWCLYWLRYTGHHTDFIKEFGDFLSEVVLAADKVLIEGDFNIHIDNEKDALGSAFIDILNTIGVRQHVSGPTHCRNHTLDLILSHGIDVMVSTWCPPRLPLTSTQRRHRRRSTPTKRVTCIYIYIYCFK